MGRLAASVGEVSALSLASQGGFCPGVRMPEPAEPTCLEVCNAAVHFPQPFVSVSVLEVLPGPARARECSLTSRRQSSGGTWPPLPTQGGHCELPHILRVGMGAASRPQAERAAGFARGEVQAEELGSANGVLLMMGGGGACESPGSVRGCKPR